MIVHQTDKITFSGLFSQLIDVILVGGENLRSGTLHTARHPKYYLITT